jgi:DNA-binding transcriptional regulator WhiA
MYSKEIEAHKKTLSLNKLQRDILIGLMLGDGHLETQNNGKTYRLKVEQSAKRAEYVQWLYENYKNFVQTLPQEKEKTRNGIVTKNIWFSTLSHGSFRFYAQQFYNGKKKVIPKIIGKLLSPIGIAVWFMDDGSAKSRKHRAKIFNTQCFSKEEVLLLIKILKDKFKINAKLREQKDGYQIYILSESVDDFQKLIGKYVIDSMRYKLD